MSGNRPLIVVTLPARTAADARSEVDEARAAGADVAEIRVDRWPPAERRRLHDLFPSELPLLATIRSAREGGDGPDDPAARAVELRRCAELPFRWIDLELDRDLPLATELPPADRLGRIISLHLSKDDLSRWSERLLALSGVDGIGKLVVPAGVSVALREIVPRLAQPRDEPVVVLTTGPSGPLLRALSRRLGAPIVFASLPERAERTAVEPSQIPVDRLRPFLDADGDAPLFSVVGRPVAHSQSPALHGAWMRSGRRDGLYVGLEFSSDEELLESIPLLAASGFRGLNVTHPFKRIAFEAATTAAPGATACGAANCLTLRDGEVIAENTDLAAIVRRLEELRGSERWDGHSLVVLGAGGAARATLAAARALSVTCTVCARRPAEARALAEEFGATYDEPDRTVGRSLVVHATSAGRADAGPLDPALAAAIGRGDHVLDWVYRPDRPVVADVAARAHASYEDGWRLFVYQAAASFAEWWGEEPADDAIAAALREGGCAG